MLGNNSQVLVSSIAAANAQMKAGKLRALACFGAKRAPALPDVPTMKELGYDVEFYLWVGLFAPKGTPAPVVTTLRDASKKAAAERQVQAGHEQSRRRTSPISTSRNSRSSGTPTPSASRTRCARSARSKADVADRGRGIA